MKKLDIYIIKKYLVSFLTIILVINSIAIVWDITEKLDDYIESNAPIRAIISYYISFVPYITILLAPLFAFIAVVYFTSRMAGKSEIVAILSSGISFYRLLVPYLIAGTFLALVMFYANHYILPAANKKRLDFENTYIRNPYTSVNIHMQMDEETFVYLRRINMLDTVGYKFALEKMKDGQLNYKLWANKIEWNDTAQNWVLHNYRSREYHPSGQVLKEGVKMDTSIALQPKDLGRKDDAMENLTTPQLIKRIEEEKLRGSDQLTGFLVKLYERSSSPFTILVLTILGISVSSRKSRGGIWVHISIGLSLAVSYIFVYRVTTVYSVNAGLPPIMGVWLPNILYGIISLYFLKIAPK